MRAVSWKLRHLGMAPDTEARGQFEAEVVLWTAGGEFSAFSVVLILKSFDLLQKHQKVLDFEHQNAGAATGLAARDRHGLCTASLRMQHMPRCVTADRTVGLFVSFSPGD